MLWFFRFNFGSIFHSFFYIIVVFVPVTYFPKILAMIFITLKVSINFSWNPGWNVLILRKFILIFNMWLSIWMWLIHLDVFCHCISRRKRSSFLVIFLYRIIREYWNMFSGGCWYSTKCYFNDNIFHFHMYLTNNRFVQFYYADIVDVHHIVKVYNMIYIVVYDNTW